MNKAEQAIIQLQQGDALIVIDLQNDFLPGGSLAVAESDHVIPIINRYIDHFQQRQLPIFMTRDWHPPDHQSFITQGGPWPVHCVAGSKGAELSADLQIPTTVHIISSGTQVDQDGYSGFENPTLKKQLDKLDVLRLFIGGLATDYCVFNTVNDALQLAYLVFLLADAIRAVNLQPEDGKNAKQEMQEKGATIITLDNIL